jgi:hypothetical protein
MISLNPSSAYRPNHGREPFGIGNAVFSVDVCQAIIVHIYFRFCCRHSIDGAADCLAHSQPRGICGTVTNVNDDVNDGIVPGAKVVLEGSLGAERRAVTAKDDASSNFKGLADGSRTTSASAPTGWSIGFLTSLILNPGQFLLLTDIKLGLSIGATSVD